MHKVISKCQEKTFIANSKEKKRLRNTALYFPESTLLTKLSQIWCKYICSRALKSLVFTVFLIFVNEFIHFVKPLFT